MEARGEEGLRRGWKSSEEERMNLPAKEAEEGEAEVQVEGNSSNNLLPFISFRSG